MKYAVLHTSDEQWHVRPCKVMGADEDSLEVLVTDKPAGVLNGYRTICMNGGNTVMAHVDVCNTEAETEEKRANQQTNDMRPRTAS